MLFFPVVFWSRSNSQLCKTTTYQTFEGFGAGNAWGSLGGVKDTNQDTYISAESFPTSNDDILRFYNSNVETNNNLGTTNPNKYLLGQPYLFRWNYEGKLCQTRFTFTCDF